MDPYRVLIPKKAAKLLEVLPLDILRLVYARMQLLAANPRPQWAKPLKGAPPGWRFRVSDYRVLYDIDDGDRVVTIRGAGHRRDVYRQR